MREYIPVEDHFDKTFAEKPDQNYAQIDFTSRALGPKDRVIVQSLLKYGITNKKCLDVGPGTGRWLTFLQQQTPSYLATIDISAESLQRCKHLCHKTQKANIETEPFDFETDTFDVVISFEVLEHLLYSDNYLSEMFRVTKPGGMVLMSTPNIASLISRIRLLFGRLPVAITSDPTHVRFFRQEDIRQLLKRYNLQPQFLPTSISLNLRKPKSKFRLPSFSTISTFDDSHVFCVHL